MPRKKAVPRADPLPSLLPELPLRGRTGKSEDKIEGMSGGKSKNKHNDEGNGKDSVGEGGADDANVEHSLKIEVTAISTAPSSSGKGSKPRQRLCTHQVRSDKQRRRW